MVDMGEWARVRVAVKRFNRAVRTMQKISRDFVVVKRKRMEVMEKVWQTVEDKQLSWFFKTYAKKIMKDMVDEIEKEIETASAREKVELRKELAERNTVGGPQYSFDWTRYRLPAHDRRLAISRFYMATLRRRVQAESLTMDRLRAIMDTQREIMGYLKSYGTETDVKPYLRSVLQGLDEIGQEDTEFKNVPNWWVLSDDMALDLIAVTARGMTQVDPYHGHPANKDLPGNAMFAKATAHAKTGSHGVIESLSRSQKKPMGKPGAQPEAKAKAESMPKVERTTPVDLEDLFSRFTPRLGAITEVGQP